MPAPSYLATQLAEDLTQIAELFGFEAEKEEAVREGSKFRVDVVWKMKMPRESPIPDINVVSIEIQYSDSPSSISHGIFKAEKTLHPSIHVVISFFKLSDDYVEKVLKPNYPQAGLVILNGEEEIKNLNFWITTCKTVKYERDRLGKNGRKIREFVLSHLQDSSQFEIEKRIRENFGFEIEEVFANARMIDKQAILLHEDLMASLSRFSDLKGKWAEYAKEGSLPNLSRAGIFDLIENMIQQTCRKYHFFFGSRSHESKYPNSNPTRSFEDIIELSDESQEIYKMLSILERSFWQRQALTNNRQGLKEFETNRQIFNAVDILCESYWKNIFGDSFDQPWKGLPVFGEYRDFRSWNSFIFAPDYLKTRFTRTWTYFSHEVAHQAISILMRRETFADILRDLGKIFSRFSTLTKWHASAEYLATETIADVVSTLISGEQYVLALTDLKYYPSFTVSPRRLFAGRAIRYPLLLRTMLCSWVMKLVWGFELVIGAKQGGMREDQVLHQAIRKVIEENFYTVKTIWLLLETDDETLETMTSGIYSALTVREYLKKVLEHLYELEVTTIPMVIRSFLRTRIIQRLKCFIRSDFYHIPPSYYYYDVDANQILNRDHIYTLSGNAYRRTSVADKIDRLRDHRISALNIAKVELEECRLVEGEPRDIIALLGSLVFEKGKSDERWNHTALCSMLSG